MTTQHFYFLPMQQHPVIFPSLCTPLTKKVGDIRIAEENVTSVVLANQTIRHRIRSQTVAYHKLTKWARIKGNGSDDWRKHSVRFVVEHVWDKNDIFTQPQPHDEHERHCCVVFC